MSNEMIAAITKNIDSYTKRQPYTAESKLDLLRRKVGETLAVVECAQREYRSALSNLACAETRVRELEQQLKLETAAASSMVRVTIIKQESQVQIKVRLSFDLRSQFPADADEHTKNDVTFILMRHDTDGHHRVDSFTYNMRLVYPVNADHFGHISVPTFVTNDYPRAGEVEYSIVQELDIQQGGASSRPELEIKNLQSSIEVVS